MVKMVLKCRRCIDRVDAVLEGEEDEEEELEQHFERQIEQERGRQVRNFRLIHTNRARAIWRTFKRGR